jgi:hypothetical protein
VHEHIGDRDPAASDSHTLRGSGRRLTRAPNTWISANAATIAKESELNAVIELPRRR